MLFLSLALILYQGQTVSTGDVFANASRALQSKDYAQAEAGFREVLRREPGNLEAMGNLGVLYSRRNLPAKAVEIYLRALRLVPDEPGLLLNLGLAYMKQDAYAKARPLFATLSQRNSPRQQQALELLGICQLQSGDTAGAIATLEPLLAGPQPSPGVYHFLALAYVKQQRQPRAQQVLDQLLVRLPAAQANYLEGRVWYDAAIFDRAQSSFDKAAAADSRLPGLALERGKTQLSLRNHEEAAKLLRLALEQDPDDLEARYFLGALLVQEGKNEEAAPLLIAVKEARPDLWGTSYYLGKAQLAIGNAAAALPLLKTAASRAPNEAPVQYQLARALQALGRKAEAQLVFARVSRLQSKANSESILMK